MARTAHRTPRHLDAPIRLGPLTLAQWLIVLLTTTLVWLALTQLAFLPVLWRVIAGSLAIGLALGFSGTGHGGSLLELPRRGWHSLVAPHEYTSGPPQRGPLVMVFCDGAPPEEDLPDA